MTQPVQPALRVHGLRKSYGTVTALDGVDLEVAPGELHGLIGVNGAGKTTLLRTLFGLVRPSAGTVEVLGEDVVALQATAPGLAGFVDRPHFHPYLDGRRTLVLLAAADGLGATGRDVDAALERVGLAAAAGRKVRGYSTGMLLRLGLAAALLRRPRLLVVDEPTEGLDPAATHDLRDVLRTLVAEGVAVLMSSHDMREVDALCSHVTVLHDGRVRASAPIEDLRRTAPSPAHRLLTSDDEEAGRHAAALRLDVAAHESGGLRVVAATPDLDRLVVALGRADVAVRALEQDTDPLTALFFSLTGVRDTEVAPVAMALR